MSGSSGPPALDPIISLAVAIAEGPGSYAFLLGSGISRDAGVPTGSQVLAEATAALYRLEKKTEDAPDESELTAWLAETGRSDLGYSGILELIAPDPASRRDFLAKHFEGVQPAEAHERLALLAEQGLAKVFVTTNFDRLLEHALQARGIEPTVITDAQDIASVVPREHAPCYVVKPHGDYLQQTIRNTPRELADLGEAMSAELAEIFERYGIVVLGYSGSDEAIASAMRARRSRYGLYWVAGGALRSEATAIVKAVGGRVIERPGATEFLRDLDRRITVFRAHPSGDTPLSVHDEVLLLLKSADRVGLVEVMRRERSALLTAIRDYVEQHRNVTPDEVAAVEAYRAFRPILERRLASLLPVIAYQPDALADEIPEIARLVEREPRLGGYAFWSELTKWAVWWLGYSLGAFATRLGRTSALKRLFDARVKTPYDTEGPLVDYTPGASGWNLAGAVLATRSKTQWLSPTFQLLVEDLPHTDVIVARWPELRDRRRSPAEPPELRLLAEHCPPAERRYGPGSLEDLQRRSY